MDNYNLNAEKALRKLSEGNEIYRTAEYNSGDISPKVREKTFNEGQSPYAVIVTCSDSRVAPEHIFNAGIGELFVIRVAGNVIGEYEMGSIQYAVEHLKCKLIVVLGHGNCGAVGAALKGGAEGFTKSITDEIKKAIDGETDEGKACMLNVQNSVNKIQSGLKTDGVKTIGAIYDIKSGKVEAVL